MSGPILLHDDRTYSPFPRGPSIANFISLAIALQDVGSRYPFTGENTAVVTEDTGHWDNQFSNTAEKQICSHCAAPQVTAV